MLERVFSVSSVTPTAQLIEALAKELRADGINYSILKIESNDTIRIGTKVFVPNELTIEYGPNLSVTQLRIFYCNPD